jgi:hypothetical protein
MFVGAQPDGGHVPVGWLVALGRKSESLQPRCPKLSV